MKKKYLIEFSVVFIIVLIIAYICNSYYYIGNPIDYVYAQEDIYTFNKEYDNIKFNKDGNIEDGDLKSITFSEAKINDDEKLLYGMVEKYKVGNSGTSYWYTLYPFVVDNEYNEIKNSYVGNYDTSYWRGEFGAMLEPHLEYDELKFLKHDICNNEGEFPSEEEFDPETIDYSVYKEAYTNLLEKGNLSIGCIDFLGRD